jgi:hypothetical protein
VGLYVAALPPHSLVPWLLFLFSVTPPSFTLRVCPRVIDPESDNMAAKQTKFMVAAAHAAPVFMNKAATIRKTIALIEQAAESDVKLLVFPETFIPGYPVGNPTWLPDG